MISVTGQRLHILTAVVRNLSAAVVLAAGIVLAAVVVEADVDVVAAVAPPVAAFAEWAH